MRVAQGGAFANLALDSALRQAGVLEPREAALATELTYGVLRWQLQLDRAIAAHSDRAPEDLDEPVRVALRVRPGAIDTLEVSGAQRLRLPITTAGAAPIDLELPPGVYTAKTPELTVRFGSPPP